MNLFGKSLSAESGSVAVASGQLSDPRCGRRDDFLHPRLAQAGGLDRFENQDALDDESLAQYASTLGLDVQRLVGEVMSGAHAARVREDFRGGERSGVNGTPTFFINGVRYDGEPDVDALVAVLTGRSSF